MLPNNDLHKERKKEAEDVRPSIQVASLSSGQDNEISKIETNDRGSSSVVSYPAQVCDTKSFNDDNNNISTRRKAEEASFNGTIIRLRGATSGDDHLGIFSLLAS